MKNIQTEKNLEFGIAKNEQLNTDSIKSPNVILYSNGCPKCKVLKNKLDMLKISYIEINNIENIKKKGFMSMPILEIGDNIMNFFQATKWIKEQI